MYSVCIKTRGLSSSSLLTQTSQAPEMFDAKHAWAALDMVEKYLLGPLGLRTLDPE